MANSTSRGALILRNVRPWGGEPAEVIIPDDGHIGEVRPLTSGAPRQSGPDDVVVEFAPSWDHAYAYWTDD